MHRVYLEMRSLDTFQKKKWWHTRAIPSTKWLKLKGNRCQYECYPMLVGTCTALENIAIEVESIHIQHVASVSISWHLHNTIGLLEQCRANWHMTREDFTVHQQRRGWTRLLCPHARIIIQQVQGWARAIRNSTNESHQPNPCDSWSVSADYTKERQGKTAGGERQLSVGLPLRREKKNQKENCYHH